MASTDAFAVYRAMLLEKRRSLLAGLATKSKLHDEQSRAAEEDQAKTIQDQDIALRLNDLDYMQFRLIEEALDRTRTGNYGLCCGCGKPIAPKRLAALPWARYCLACQEKRDASVESGEQILPPPGRVQVSDELVMELMRHWRDEQEL